MTAVAIPELGDRVRYKFNGFTGIVTARTEYLSGDTKIEITPERLNPDGSWLSPVWCFASEVEMVQKGKAATG